MAKKKAPEYHFPNIKARATAYAAYMYLGRLLKEDGDFDPGFEMDVSGLGLTIIIPPDTTVSRSLGTDGKGHDFHNASQNLNGFAVLTVLAQVLKKFNQWKWLKDTLFAAIKAAVKTKTMGTEDKLVQADPELEAEIAALKAEITADIPKRKQDTTRDVSYHPELPPTLVWTFEQSKAA